MVQEGVAVALVLAIWSIMLLGCGVLYHRGKARSRELELHAPLHPESTVHRLDAALSQAEEGFNVCSGCGFENFKRSIFCMVCGEVMAEPLLDETDRRQSSAKKSRTSKLSHTPSTPRMETVSTINARRQERARKRREWVRKKTSKDRSGGASYTWVRDTDVSAQDADDAVRLPSVVPQFVSKTFQRGFLQIKIVGTAAEMDNDDIAAAEPTHDSSTASDSGSSTEQGDIKPAALIPIRITPDERVAELEAEVADIRLDLVPATDMNAIHFPVDIDHSNAETQVSGTTEMYAAHFHRDFPSKLAEFVTATTELFVSPDTRHMKMHLDRDSVIDDSLKLLGLLQDNDVRVAFRIDFVNEKGLDAGGVYREWFLLINEGLIKPEAGIFRCVDKSEQTFYLNPHSKQDIGDDHLLYFLAVGRLLGRSLLEGNPTCFHLALPLLKIILGQPVGFHDLEYFDPPAYKNLVWLMENDGIDALELDFSVCEKVGGKTEIIDLIPNGRNIPVTDANKAEYLDRRFRYMLFESVQDQLYAFLKGLYQVIPPDLFLMFDAEELDFVFCGADEIDVDDWERNTKYTSDLYRQPVLTWFWEIVREMPDEYRRRLLQFSTGSSRVPFAGFKGVDIWQYARQDAAAHVEALVTVGLVAVDERNDDGETALHVAAAAGSDAVVQVLLRHGADLRLSDWESGWTALHRSVYFEHLTTTLLLLRHARRVYGRKFMNEYLYETRDHDRETPMEMISRKTSPDKAAEQGRHRQGGMVYTFGKVDFQLGYHLPHVNVQSSPRLVELPLGYHLPHVNVQSSPRLVELPVPQSVVQISASKFHTVALNASGEVFAWGFGKGGRLGTGTEFEYVTHVEPTRLSLLKDIPIARVAAGENHTVALSRSGQVFSWGSNSFGQLGHQLKTCSHESRLTPKRIDAFRGMTMIDIAASGCHSGAICGDDGSVFTWGLNKRGQLGRKDGFGSDQPNPGPRRVDRLVPGHALSVIYESYDDIAVAQVAMSDVHTCVVLRCSKNGQTIGQVWQFGYGSNIPTRINFKEKRRRTDSHLMIDSWLPRHKMLETDIVSVSQTNLERTCLDYMRLNWDALLEMGGKERLDNLFDLMLPPELPMQPSTLNSWGLVEQPGHVSLAELQRREEEERLVEEQRQILAQIEEENRLRQLQERASKKKDRQSAASKRKPSTNKSKPEGAQSARRTSEKRSSQGSAAPAKSGGPTTETTSEFPDEFLEIFATAPPSELAGDMALLTCARKHRSLLLARQHAKRAPLISSARPVVSSRALGLTGVSTCPPTKDALFPQSDSIPIVKTAAISKKTAELASSPLSTSSESSSSSSSSPPRESTSPWRALFLTFFAMLQPDNTSPWRALFLTFFAMLQPDKFSSVSHDIDEDEDRVLYGDDLHVNSVPPHVAEAVPLPELLWRFDMDSYAANKHNEDRTQHLIDALPVGWLNGEEAASHNEHDEADVAPVFFCGCYDGHGGEEAVEYVQRNLYRNIKLELAETNRSVQDAIVAGFQRTDQEFHRRSCHEFEKGAWSACSVGACAVMALVVDRKLYVASCGDCRAIMAFREPDGSLSVEQITWDHSANDKREQERLRLLYPDDYDIVRELGRHNYYVKGRLQPTRSLGDTYMKVRDVNKAPMPRGLRIRGNFSRPYISAIPDVFEVDLADRQPEFVVLGSDGLYGELSNEEIVDLVDKFREEGEENVSTALRCAILDRVAEYYGLHAWDLEHIPPGERRTYHDDITIDVLHFTPPHHAKEQRDAQAEAA
ncbi:hypothetical protein P43SY_006755 [Pythium insidiosum]|uniref:E3 ubiquitin-protein ligase HACE1 n=1 Tax=Pythium insidiosum TaxID=114742 RepID=A0AAD5QF02_PYTIN|nr:hypothetical protein P43SY_006755 [Pythium insidiosum]